MQISLSCCRLALYDWTTVGWQGETFAMGLWGFFWDFGCSRDRSSWPTTLSTYRCLCSSQQCPMENLSSPVLSIAPAPGEHKLTRLFFSLCAAVFSLVWLMRSIQTPLPWPLTPPTSGFPVYTMTTACMCGMSKIRRKWARCTLLCITPPACGTLRYVVCRHVLGCELQLRKSSDELPNLNANADCRGNWLRFSPVVSAFAAGPGNSSLAALQWLTECVVLLRKKNLTIKRWEVGEGAELNKPEYRASF